MECNFIFKKNSMTKPAIQQRKSKKIQPKIKTLNKTDVEILSIGKSVETLLSNLAINSFKPSSIAN